MPVIPTVVGMDEKNETQNSTAIEGSDPQAENPAAAEVPAAGSILDKENLHIHLIPFSGPEHDIVCPNGTEIGEVILECLSEDSGMPKESFRNLVVADANDNAIDANKTPKELDLAGDVVLMAQWE